MQQRWLVCALVCAVIQASIATTHGDTAAIDQQRSHTLLESDAVLTAQIQHDSLSTLISELTDLRDFDDSCASGDEESHIIRRLAAQPAGAKSIASSDLPNCESMRRHVKKQLKRAAKKLKRQGARCKKSSDRCDHETRKTVRMLSRALPLLKRAVYTHMRYGLLKSLYSRAHNELAHRPATIERLSVMLQQCRDEMANLHRNDQLHQQRMTAMLMALMGLAPRPNAAPFAASTATGFMNAFASPLATAAAATGTSSMVLKDIAVPRLSLALKAATVRKLLGAVKLADAGLALLQAIKQGRIVTAQDVKASVKRSNQVSKAVLQQIREVKRDLSERVSEAITELRHAFSFATLPQPIFPESINQMVSVLEKLRNPKLKLSPRRIAQLKKQLSRQHRLFANMPFASMVPEELRVAVTAAVRAARKTLAAHTAHQRVLRAQRRAFRNLRRAAKKLAAAGLVTAVKAAKKTLRRWRKQLGIKSRRRRSRRANRRRPSRRNRRRSRRTARRKANRRRRSRASRKRARRNRKRNRRSRRGRGKRSRSRRGRFGRRRRGSRRARRTRRRVVRRNY